MIPIQDSKTRKVKVISIYNRAMRKVKVMLFKSQAWDQTFTTRIRFILFIPIGFWTQKSWISVCFYLFEGVHHQHHHYVIMILTTFYLFEGVHHQHYHFIIMVLSTFYLFEGVHHQGEQCQKVQLILPRALLSTPWVIMMEIGDYDKDLMVTKIFWGLWQRQLWEWNQW